MASWKCGNCGYTLEADTPPDQCPSCKEKCKFLDNTCYTPDCEFEGTDKRIRFGGGASNGPGLRP